MQRLPAAWAAAVKGMSRVFGKSPFDKLRTAPFDRSSVADDQCRVEVGARHARMQREQTLCAIGSPVGRGFDERVRSGAEFEREFFHTFAKGVPRVEAVLACDDRLRIVERKRRAREISVGMARERRQDAEPRECVGVVGARGAQQIFRLPLQVVEIRAVG